MTSKDDQVKQIATNVVDSLAAIEESFRQAKLDLLKRENELFRPLYAKREKLTSAIPHFWSTVLATEDELADFIGEYEADLLKSCTMLRVLKKAEDPRDFTITMEFGRNAYLENSSCSMQKDFKFDNGRLTSQVVKLDWKKGKNLPELAAKEDRLSFFSILEFVGTSDDDDDDNDNDKHDDDNHDRVDDEAEEKQLMLEDMTMLIVDEVYPHALSYFTDALLPPPPQSSSSLQDGDSAAARLADGSNDLGDDGTTNGLNTPALESMTHSFLDQQARFEAAQELGAGKSQNLSGSNTKNVEKYAAETSTPLPEDLMRHRAESIEAFNELKMITVNEAQFLHCLTASLDCSRVLEIGCFTGFSALTFADAGAQEILTCELDAELSAFAKLGIHRAGKSELIKVLTGDAHETVRNTQLVKGKFDLIFIDAEKRGYADYLQVILQRGLLADKGIILADNTLRRGIMVDMVFPARHLAIESLEEKRKNDLFEQDLRGMKQFNDVVSGLQDYESVLLPVWDGLTMIRRK